MTPTTQTRVKALREERGIGLAEAHHIVLKENILHDIELAGDFQELKAQVLRLATHTL